MTRRKNNLFWHLVFCMLTFHTLLFPILSSCTFTCPPPHAPHLRLLWVFHMLTELARLLRGSAPWNWTCDTATALQKMRKKTCVMLRLDAWHQPAKMQQKVIFVLLPGHTFASGQFLAKPEHVQPSFFVRLAYVLWDRGLEKERGTFLMCTYL